MINRKFFFEKIKSNEVALYKKFTQQQVDGMSTILTAWEHFKYTDLRQLAYMFATVFHETARTFDFSIEEFGKGKGKAYGVPDEKTGKIYYGRGPVQITWKENYKKFQDITQMSLVANPELACRPEVATVILFEGMIRGIFTGKKLSDYFNESECDWINARRIINGTDRAELIAGYAQEFMLALKEVTI